MAQADDQNLIDRARDGDVRAFEQLIRPHVDSIRRLAYSFRPNWSDADDLAQEALIRAYRNIGSFRREAALSTWLYTVARSAFLDWLRGRSAKARGREDTLSEPPPDSADPQDQLLQSRREAEALWAAIRRLDPRFRIPLVLFDIEGLPYERVAAIEGVPVGTIKSRLSRARGQLRALLLAEEAAESPDPGTDSARSSSNLSRRPVQ